jgi:hypothetical protein
MSNNLNEINSKLTHISIDSSKSDSPLAKLARENAPAPVKTHGSTWVCPECDKVNPNAKRVCMDCGYER